MTLERPKIDSKEAALERVAYLEEKSSEKVKASVSLGYVELTRAEDLLHTWRKEINSLKKIWKL
jgi:hypothetical protein